MSDYPEHDKMAAMRSELDAVSDFLERLYAGDFKFGGLRLWMGYEVEDGYGLASVEPGITDLLAQWSGIDQNKIEQEKRQMLERIRNDSS